MKRKMGTYVRAIKPIARQEFSQMLQKAMPPPGWGETIAVANSGGPDSTCLLFLLHRHFTGEQTLVQPNYMQTEPTRKKDATHVVSLTIDHGLQASSSDMAARTADFAKSLGVQHSTRKIGWGQGVFPQRPTPGSSFEETARRARYRLLFEDMARFRADALALGHHLDDQVETALMRLGMRSSILGASGMKYCRRWGMGNVVEGLDWAGHQGMNKWMVRPFLGVEKDRILATCEANRLEYVVDNTNFQPELTLRNAVRHIVRHGKEASASLPPTLLKQVGEIDKALQSLPDFDGGLDSGPERLRELVQGMSKEVAELEIQVDSIIQNSRLPSPEGTFAISREALLNLKDQPILQKVLILRILLYVSPKPWGSLRSQGKRRSHRLAELASCLMGAVAKSSELTMPTFAMGSEVLWKPVFYRRKKFKVMTTAYSPRSQDVVAWLACRQPPDAQTMHHTADIDLTAMLLECVAARSCEGNSKTLEVLHDCRFLVRIDLDAIPQDLVRVLSGPGCQLILSSDKRWFHPILSLQTPSQRQILHNRIDKADGGEPKPKERLTFKSAPWVNIKFIRTLHTVIQQNSVLL